MRPAAPAPRQRVENLDRGGWTVKIRGADLHGTGPGNQKLHHVVDVRHAANADHGNADGLGDLIDGSQGDRLDRRTAQASEAISQHARRRRQSMAMPRAGVDGRNRVGAPASAAWAMLRCWSHWASAWPGSVAGKPSRTRPRRGGTGLGRCQNRLRRSRWDTRYSIPGPATPGWPFQTAAPTHEFVVVVTRDADHDRNAQASQVGQVVQNKASTPSLSKPIELSMPPAVSDRSRSDCRYA